jgi:hypothetical protein
MKKKKLLYQFIFVSLIMFLLSSCTHFDEPGLINQPDQTYSENPVITGITPSDSAVAGVREIIIAGQNFSIDGKDTNWVYIGGKAAEIKSVSSSQLVVYRPVIFGNSLDINVVIPSALSIAKVLKYKIEEPVIEFSDFSYQHYTLTAFDVDNQENIYVGTHRALLKLAPNGIDLNEIAGSSTLGSAFNTFTDMKFGPGGYLYALVGRKDIYRLDPATGENNSYVTLPNNSDKLDFDANQNIYTGRRDGILVVNSDKTITSTGKYDNIPIVEIRVLNGYLYTASASTLWKNQILDDKGSLGDDETVVDISSIPSLSNCEISSFNMDNQGTVFLCLKNHPQYSIFVLENDGSVTPFYKADILPQSVDQIIYGSGRYMYLSRGLMVADSVRFYRMGMEHNGAPYLGRQE